MRYDKLTSAQKGYAQTILNKLRDAGVSESVSQVAKYFDDAVAWDKGDISLASLLDRTRWSRSGPVETIHRAELPASVLRHVRSVLASEGSSESLEALELLPEV